MKLRELGEFPFLRRLRERLPVDARVALGVGDDCAVLALPGTTLLTTDALVEDVHFRREWTTFTALGEKAFAVNASDIAAMGGEPMFALLSLSVPQDTEVEDLDAFFAGFIGAAQAHGASLIGGNLSAAPCLMIAVTLLGRAEPGTITRSGAQVGDDVYVTGTLGDAALGLRLLQEGRDGTEERTVIERFLRPAPRVAVGREVAARGVVRAMIDVSDGLLQDLGHLCEQSRVGAEVEAAALPLSLGYRSLLGESEWDLALTGGEDYELLFTAAGAHRPAVRAVAETSHCRITRIGRVVARGEGVRVYGPDGAEYRPPRAGYDHFRRA